MNSPICKHIAKAQAQTKALSAAPAKPTEDKIVFKKFPDPSKNKKRNTQPDRQ